MSGTVLSPKEYEELMAIKTAYQDLAEKVLPALQNQLDVLAAERDKALEEKMLVGEKCDNALNFAAKMSDQNLELARALTMVDNLVEDFIPLLRNIKGKKTSETQKKAIATLALAKTLSLMVKEEVAKIEERQP